MTLNKIKLVEICFFFYLWKIKTQRKKKPRLQPTRGCTQMDPEIL